MSTRNRVYLALAIVFTVVNLVGLGMAAAAGEGWHSAVHVVLGLLGALGVWRLANRGRDVAPPDAALADVRLEQLQQSVDAIAVEVERIGEAQRFHTKLQAEQGETTR